MASNSDRRPPVDGSLGIWSKDQILRITDENNSVLLQQSLLQASDKFFQPQPIKEMGQAQVNSIDSKGPKKIPRVSIHLGTTQQHESNYDCLHKLVDSNCNTFTEMLMHFYDDKFNSDEKDSILKAMNHTSTLHLTVYNRIRIKPPRNKPISQYDMLLGAASFILLDTNNKSSLLLYLGVTKYDFHNKKDSITLKQMDDSKGSMQRCYKLGTFLLCCVQRVTYIHLNTFDIVAQVNNDRKRGAIMFYRKNFFVAAWKQDEHLIGKIYDQREHNKKFFTTTKELTTMISIGPIFLLNTWWFDNVEKPSRLQLVIETGLDHILKIDKMTSNYKSIEEIRNQGEALSKVIPMQRIDKRIEDKKKDGPLDEKETLYGDEAEIRNIISERIGNSPISLKDHKQGKEHGGTSCAYITMSVALFGSPIYYKEVRLFFYMLFHAISKMGIKSTLFDFKKAFDDATKNEGQHDTGVYAFLIFLTGCHSRLLEFDANEEIYNTMNDFPENVDEHLDDPNAFRVLLRELAFAQLEYDFYGGDFEFVMLKEIIKITFVTLLATSKDEKNKEDNKRLWSLGVAKKTDTWRFLQDICREIKVLSNREPSFFYAAMVENNNHFLEVEPNKNFEAPQFVIDLTKEGGGEKLEQTVSEIDEWIGQRNGKWIPIEGDNVRNIGKLFHPSEFFHHYLDRTIAVACARMLDPMKKDADTEEANLLDGTSSYRDISTLRPNSYVNDQIIKLFTRYCSKFTADKRIKFVHPQTVNCYNDFRDTNVTRIKEELENTDYVLVASHVGYNHWIVIELDVGYMNDSDNLNVKYADSLVKKTSVESFVKENYRSLWLLVDVFAHDRLRQYVKKEIDTAPAPKSESEDPRKKAMIKVLSAVTKIEMAEDVEKQDNLFDCGVCVMKRIYAFSRLTLEDIQGNYSNHAISAEIAKQPIPRYFRLFVLGTLLKQAKDLRMKFSRAREKLRKFDPEKYPKVNDQGDIVIMKKVSKNPGFDEVVCLYTEDVLQEEENPSKENELPLSQTTTTMATSSSVNEKGETHSSQKASVDPLSPGPTNTNLQVDSGKNDTVNQDKESKPLDAIENLEGPDSETLHSDKIDNTAVEGGKAADIEDMENDAAMDMGSQQNNTPGSDLNLEGPDSEPLISSKHFNLRADKLYLSGDPIATPGGLPESESKLEGPDSETLISVNNNTSEVVNEQPDTNFDSDEKMTDVSQDPLDELQQDTESLFSSKRAIGSKVAAPPGSKTIKNPDSDTDTDTESADGNSVSEDESHHSIKSISKKQGKGHDGNKVVSDDSLQQGNTAAAIDGKSNSFDEGYATDVSRNSVPAAKAPNPKAGKVPKNRPEGKPANPRRPPGRPSNHDRLKAMDKEKRRDTLKKQARKRLRDYDEGKDAPHPNSGFTEIPQDLLQRLVDEHKNGLPEEQQDDWMEHAFYPSQKDSEAARKEINKLLQKDLKKLTKEFKAVDAELGKLKKEQKKEWSAARDKLFNKKLKRWEFLDAKINMMKWELQEVPIFHPRDSIYAIQFADKVGGIQYFWCCAKEDDGNVVCKKLPEELVRHYLKDLFVDCVKKIESEKDWVCLTGDGAAIFDKNDPKCSTGNLEPLYKFCDPSCNQQLHFVRLLITWDNDLYLSSKTKKFKPAKMEWAVRSSKERRYEKVTEAFLQDVITEKRVTDLKTRGLAISTWEVKNNKTQQIEIVNKDNTKKLVDRFVDQGRDPEFAQKIHNIGRMLEPQPIYFDMRKEYKDQSFPYNLTTVQISKLRYDWYKQHWFGVEQTDKNNRATKIVPLSDEWVREAWKNQPKALEQIRQKAEQGLTHFISVPIGDAIALKPTMDITFNPMIRYHQGNEPTCAYSSLSSALFYLNWTDEAEAVMLYGKNFLLDNSSPMDKILPSLITFVRNDPRFRCFRKCYRIIRKVDCDYDLLLESKQNPSNIKLIVLKQSDNHQSHAITVVDEYIFDSNAENCLPLSKEGLDVCCGDKKYDSVANGYLFEMNKSSTQASSLSSSKRAKTDIDFSSYPNLRYQCACIQTSIHSSLASAIFYLNLIEESIIINQHGQDLPPKFKKASLVGVMKNLQNFLRNDPRLKLFRNIYGMGQKIAEERLDFLYENPYDLKLIVLRHSRNQNSSPIAVVDEYIFHGNQSNCIPLTKDGLSHCCFGNECLSIAFGYCFKRAQKRNSSSPV